MESEILLLVRSQTAVGASASDSELSPVSDSDSEPSVSPDSDSAASESSSVLSAGGRRGKGGPIRDLNCILPLFKKKIAAS